MGNIFLMVALLATLIGHWAVLQSVAWTTMLADNLRHGSFVEAFSQVMSRFVKRLGYSESSAGFASP